MPAEIYYRYEGSGNLISLVKLRFIKQTRAGIFVDYFGEKKFILSGARKKFAHDNLEDAAESFIRRKKKHIAILKAQLESAENCLETFEDTGNREFINKYGYVDAVTKFRIDL